MSLELRSELIGAMQSTRPGQSPVRVLRQHHAIEHATMTIISGRAPGSQVVARSDLQGFIVYGSIDIQILQAAAEEALARLQAGEAALAIHANCGTNLVTAGIVSGLAAFVAGGGRNRSLWDRVPSAILGATLALIVAAPLGRWAQANLTTTSQVRGLRIASVVKIADNPVVRHRVVVGE
jgi:ABC-type phosphate/phosphonate transport system permease subunit